ncbi:hypothetical protein D3C78_1404350 [compost metagenome]
MPMGVIFAHQQRQFLAVPRHLEAFIDCFDQLQALELVGNVSRPFFLWRQALAQVVQQARPAHGQWLFMYCGLLQHAQGMCACIDFRVVGGWLRYAKQRVDFGHQHLECVACA